MAFSLTEEQQAAVDNRGGGLLVSAAAGSGKTRVLVERLLARVEEGADVDRFLVITYTKAAAAELRSRIVQELSDRLALRPTDGHLRRQATLVYKAGISTIHAFCAQLLRECGHLLDLDPDFRLCDEGEAGILMLRALNDVLDRRYEAMDSDFAQLVDTMSAGRDDARLIQIVLDIRGRVQAHPNPAAWLEEQERTFALEGISDPVQTPWGQLLLADAAGQAAYWRRRMEEARDLCERDANLLANYGDSVAQTAQALQQFVEAASQGWDAARALLPIPFPTVGRKKMVDDPAAVERVKVIRSACKKRLEKLEDWFADSGDDLLADLRTVYPAMRGLFALVRDFEEAYAAEKARRGLVDFSDLEHMAVRLLVGEDGQPTELARQWSTRYDEIMVDEYQDTNEVQNAIFSALSKDGTNLFMVGDVKQSIYRFRLADPTIFLGKYRSFKPYTEAGEGEERRVILSRNFRSRPEVLEGCNDLFRAVMSVPFGEMEYSDDQALYPGAPFQPDSTYCVELDALDGDIDGEEGAEKVSRDLLEARFAARRIQELLDQNFPVSDGEGGTRPVRPSDMVILLRSPNTVLRHYARALAERDILWEAEGGGNFFGSTEISVALSLLQIVDNPRQDVPLISVLRSPVYGFSADRLAEIRSASPDTDFYAALAADDGADSRAFLAELDDLRFGSGDMSSHQLLWHIYDRTNLLGIFGAMEEGETRQGNLLALAELARQFEGEGHKGLFRFLTYLTRLRENGNTLMPPTPGRTGGGVRIMSIHKSKGLEFPVVLLCGLARRLNREDMSRPILFHPKLGVGPKGLDVERGIEYPTLARMAVARQLEREMMAEELRLLYVAMTRAKEKLILSVALTGGGKDLEKLAGDAGDPVDPQVLLACQSVGQWVLLHALCRPEAGALRRAAGQDEVVLDTSFGPAWDIRFVDGTPLAQMPPHRWTAPQREQEEEEGGEDLTDLLRWTYPHEAEVAIPSKLTATQLKGRALDEEAAEEAPRPARPLSFGRPRFAAEEMGLTAAQQGTALHQVLQYIDFERSETVEGVRAEIARLVEQQYITPQQGEAVDPAPIAAFFQSDLGQELLSSVSLQREFKFSILEPANRYYPQAGEEEQVLFQGVVDCYYETLEGITVVDFKTDRVTKRTVAERAEHYRPQLEAYSRALAEITGKQVIRRVLWFFALNQSVDL
ncbi:helicase-exonuclease AddAB subunit AddA [Flavonifractor sp. An91]|uniref:helicase-exonuclease AddAB subunit AddA n=1 Tax=Flavonifractor sp. An91 TaxID=1965665 RepID=UPI000B3834FB|nr:helicase-exonuclease AddAB subunit AddA [Flavonifractor sp. An91]OUN14344.1 helicase-exonuclease AddAB subunit AddA [Flavonifractor sp. An91]